MDTRHVMTWTYTHPIPTQSTASASCATCTLFSILNPNQGAQSTNKVTDCLALCKPHACIFNITTQHLSSSIP